MVPLGLPPTPHNPSSLYTALKHAHPYLFRYFLMRGRVGWGWGDGLDKVKYKINSIKKH